MNTVQALTFDFQGDGWETSRGFVKRTTPMPILGADDTDSVILKINFAGVCGSDRGIWNRQAFKDLIHGSLQKEGKSLRILGHEFLGEVVEVGSLVQNVKIGDMVSGDSHITCGQCYQCKLGENNVCTNEKILGISTDGIFAEFVKIPARNLFVVDTAKVRPEIAAIMDPFGNAVHSVSKFDPKEKLVAVFGVGPIGLFAVALLKQAGAKKIIAIDINQANLDMAKRMGASDILLAGEVAAAAIMEITGGVGVDVAMEMAGPVSSLLSSLACVRRGGQVVLFGIKDGDVTIPKFSQIITRGLTLHGVIGRRIFETWHQAWRVLERRENGVQDAIWEVLLRNGQGTIIPFASYQKNEVALQMQKNPKIIFKF